MDYQEQLNKIQNAIDSNSVSEIESVRNAVELERQNKENLGNSMVLMAAQNALEKLKKKKESTTIIPEWRLDQAVRTGGSVEEIERMTHEINEKAEKSVLQGWYNIIAAIPESLRTNEQRQEFHDLEQSLKEIQVKIEQKTRGILTETVERERVADNLAKLDLGVIGPAQAVIEQSLDNQNGHMESMIAAGENLWGIEEHDDEIQLQNPIQPTEKSINRNYQEYLTHEIGTIGSQISAGFGNEQALNRGVELEQKLTQHQSGEMTSESVPVVTQKESKIEESMNPESLYTERIANLKRDDLYKLSEMLKENGPIDGISPDQLFASIKIFMRGASDDSHIPETYGLRAKMNEIKRIRDTELSYHGFTIDKESGAITAEQINSSEPPQEDGEEQVTDIVTESVPMRVPEVVAMVEESELSSEIAESAQIEEKHDPKEIMRKQQDVLAHKIFKSQSFKELLDALETEPLVQNDTASQPTMIVQQSILRYLQGYQIGNPPSIYSITTIHATELRVEQLIEEATKKGNLNELIEEAMKAYPGLVEKESLTVIDVPTNFSEQVGNMAKVVQEEMQEDDENPWAFLKDHISTEEKIEVTNKNVKEDILDNQEGSQKNNQLPELEIELPQQEDLEDNYEEDSYKFEKRLFESLITYSGEEGIFALLGTKNLSLSKDGYIIADGKETNYTPSMIDLNAEIQKNTGMTPHQLREKIRDQISHEKNNQKIEIKQTPETEKKKPEDLFLDDNDQEHIELPEKKDFSHVKTFDELYTLIDSIKEIQDSERTYSNESLKQIINNVRKGDAILGDITNTRMLRDKVRELLIQERIK